MSSSNSGESGTIAVESPRPRSGPDNAPRKLPPYNVVLLDDNEHTYPYVIRMLGKLFGHDATRAYKLAKHLDTTGRVILLTTTKEHAEFKRDQIHAFGRDHLIASCAGAMSAIIEPAQGEQE